MAPSDKTGPCVALDLPEVVTSTVAAVRGAGGDVWVVGGAVRDALSGRRTSDWDLATTMPPGALTTALPGFEAIDARLGAFRMAAGDLEVAVTTLREERGYTDRRRPDHVHFVTDLAVDAQRRDFTVNALYADPTTGVVVDPCGGVADLEAGVLRVIGDARARLAEDPLRLLRAARFAGALRLVAEVDSAAALRDVAGELRALSAERTLAELTRMFTGNGRALALKLLVDWGLAAVALPEVAAMAGVEQPRQFHPEGDVLTHTCRVLANVPPGDAVLAWSAVLHDIGKPPTFERAADRIRFSGHDVLSERMAVEVLRRLRAPNELVDAVAEICRDHIRFAALPQMGRAKRERWLRSSSFGLHLAFHRADCLGSHGDLSLFEMARRMLAELPPEAPPPLCTGRDVLALGVAAGPVVGAVLRKLEARLDAEEAPDRERALVLLREIVANPDSSGGRR